MIVTEEEAQAKWCPMIGFPVYALTPPPEHLWHRIARLFGRKSASNICCIGSACMLWKWEARFAEICIPEGANHPGDGWVSTGRRRINERTYDTFCRITPDGEKIGYCGLAGKVEP